MKEYGIYYYIVDGSEWQHHELDSDGLDEADTLGGRVDSGHSYR